VGALPLRCQPGAAAASVTLGSLDTNLPAASPADHDTGAKARLPRFARYLGAIAIAALVVRILFTVVVDPSIGQSPEELSDARAYHLLGENLAEGRGYVRPFDLERLGIERPTAEYPPLFPALLAALDRAGVDSVDGQQLALCFLGTLTVVGIGLIGRRVGGDPVGLTAAAIAAVYPMLFQADAILMAESLYALLVTAVILLAYRAADRPKTGSFAALGASLGLAALTRSEGILLAVVLVLPVALRLHSLPWARRLRLACIALGVATLVVTPWTVRNYARFDTLVPVSNNLGTVLDGANCPLTYSGTQLGSWRSTFGSTVAAGSDCFEGFDITQPDFDEAIAAAFHRDAGLRYARDHAGDLPMVAAARLGRTFGAYDVFEQVRLESLEGRTVRWQTLGTRMFWLLIPFAVAGAVLLSRRRANLAPLLATVALVVITSVLTYGNQRFRIAAEPATVVLAASGVVTVGRIARRRFVAGHDVGPL